METLADDTIQTKALSNIDNNQKNVPWEHQNKLKSSRPENTYLVFMKGI